MEDVYVGIKYLGPNDLACGYELQRAQKILSDFNPTKVWKDINEIIELYNIKKYFDEGIYLKDWKEETIFQYKQLMPALLSAICNFMISINNDNFIKTASAVKAWYKRDFWELFVSYSGCSRVEGEIFSQYLTDDVCCLYSILQNPKLVKRYDREIAEFMRGSNQTAEILISKFFGKDDNVKCFLPKELKPEEYEGILIKYIESGTANVNKLNLLSLANSTGECPVSDKLKLKARREFKRFWEDNKNGIISSESNFNICFKDKEKIKEFIRVDGVNTVIYDIKWLSDNLDFPTVLNNFIYIFDHFDLQMRCKYVTEEWPQSAFMNIFNNLGKAHYNSSSIFEHMNSFYNHQTLLYYDFLKNNDVRLEDIFRWFFEDYLRYEFGVEGFSFNPPTDDATLAEKCRTMASEMDGVLKQYRLFLEEGEIDRELLEISSEHINFSNLESLLGDKFAYGVGEKIEKEQFLLFSDQCMLQFTERFKTRFKSFAESALNEELKLSDFRDDQKGLIKWLSERGAVILDENNYIHLDMRRVTLMKELYIHKVVCLNYCVGIDDILQKLHSGGELVYKNSLFSVPEQNYLNYVLNRSKYSNGLDLRNKYIHGTYPKDEDKQRCDYIEIIRTMLVVIFKINEEFCLKESHK